MSESRLPTPDADPPAPRAPYLVPRLQRLGAATELTRAVMMQGAMDGFMGRRTS